MGFQGKGNTELKPGGANGAQGSSYMYRTGTTPNTRTAISQKVRLMSSGYGQTTALQIGVISSFTKSESRTIEPVRGIGFGDQIAELVPSVTEPTSLAFERALLYLSNLWQSVGYAAGTSGPVRSLRHHKWPFDVEEQIVFSTLVDGDFAGNQANIGVTGGEFQKGLQKQQFPEVTRDDGGNGNPVDKDNRGHTALITLYEACWFQDHSVPYSKDAGTIMESGTAMATDVTDAASLYGEFLATGNDPSLGQRGARRFGNGTVTV